MMDRIKSSDNSASNNEIAASNSISFAYVCFWSSAFFLYSLREMLTAKSKGAKSMAEHIVAGKRLPQPPGPPWPLLPKVYAVSIDSGTQAKLLIRKKRIKLLCIWIA